MNKYHAWMALLAVCGGVACAQTNPRAVPTYEAAGLYWTNPPGNPTAGCTLRFRKVGDTTWIPGFGLWFDSAGNECRGSIVGLTPGTDYEAELTAQNQARTLSFRTWANQKPIKKTNTVPAGSTTYTVSESGNATEGYVVYQGTPTGAVIDVNNTASYNVVISASYVIVRGLVLRGAQRHGILISPNVTDVIIEDNEITNWGGIDPLTNAPRDLDSGIRAICSGGTIERVTIQRNEIHDPRYSANNWSQGHPAGPQGITFSFCGGNHVIRHNEIFSTNGNHFNDAIGGEDNYSRTGFPNADSDIYQNEISHAWDDGIEAEGGNRNVRIWGNYLNLTGTGIASTVTAVGPLYLFRNVWNRNQFYDNVPSDQDDRQPFFKSGSDSTLGFGRRYIFHNTMLQAPPPPGPNSLPLGGGLGLSGTGTSALVQNTVSKNNIFHKWKDTWTAYYQIATSGNDFERDMYNGTAGATVTNGINATPVYLAGNGAVSESGGLYALASTSRGFDEGVRINNFNDDFLGAAPDVGAHESGAAPMKFGLAASAGSAVPPPPALAGVTSKKAHATAGTFSLAVDATQPVGGAVSVEPRVIGSGHKIVMTFNTSVFAAGTATCTDVNGAALGTASAAAVGNTVEITLTGVPDRRRARITLANVNNAGLSFSAAIGFLAGDVDGSRAVTSSDILRTKGRLAQALSNATFAYDVDLSGVIDAAGDVAAVKANAGLEL